MSRGSVARLWFTGLLKWRGSRLLNPIGSAASEEIGDLKDAVGLQHEAEP